MAADLTAREAGVTARAATWADADALARTMAAAFADDPLLCYILNDPKTREAKMPAVFKLLFKLGLPCGGRRTSGRSRSGSTSSTGRRCCRCSAPTRCG